MSTQRSSTPAPTVPPPFELRDLSDARFRVVKPIKVTWEIVDGTYIAEAPDLEEYGEGDTPDEAIQDLQVSIVELFFDLDEYRDRLGAGLQPIYDTLTRSLRKGGLVSQAIRIPYANFRHRPGYHLEPDRRDAGCWLLKGIGTY